MRLSLLLPVALVVTALTGSAASGDSNLSLDGAPRHNLDGVLPILDLEEQYIRSQTDDNVKASSGTSFRCTAKAPCPDGSCCNSQGMRSCTRSPVATH